MIANFTTIAHAPQPTQIVAPLCPALNVAVQAITSRLFPGGFDIGPEAPSSYRKLREWMAPVSEGGQGRKLMVSSDGLDGSIYASPGINAMFRAWHDWHHYHGGHDFSPAGEHATAVLQCLDLVNVYGEEGSREMCLVLMADVVGQSLYYKHHGKFVIDQMGFVKAYLANSNLALLREW